MGCAEGMCAYGRSGDRVEGRREARLRGEARSGFAHVGVRRRLRDLSVIDKITSKTWKGRFRNAGARIRIPCLPLVQTNKRKPGDPVAYQDLKGSEEVFTINRERDVAFHVEVEDNIFSPMNLESAVNFDMIKLVNPPLLLSPPCGWE